MSNEHKAHQLRTGVGRSVAALNDFFVWWGEHRGWPASEPARLPGCVTVERRPNRR